MTPDFTEWIFKIKNETDFKESALEIFKWQAEKNPVYKNFINELSVTGKNIKSPENIPFLPIAFFKQHKIVTGSFSGGLVFESSGTTGLSVSRHYITDPEIYKRSFLLSFSLFYGDPSDYFIAALLPSYSERKNSSLVYMADELIKRSATPLSGFYKDNIAELLSNIKKSKAEKRKILLIGVSYALLDLAEKYSPDLSGVIVVETGGMKGRRKEITRGELHSILRKSFNLDVIHSEYGMTELLSQAWSRRDGLYYCPPWMKIFIRDPYDPLTIITEPGITGGINVIDLANFHSCSFIATGDQGKLHKDGGFEVLGRLDNSDIRGCNLLIE
jgi:phenylacetate-coenzyme A ligase PaaK-like adenylate-forming protein